MGTTGGSLADLKIDRSEPERMNLWPLLLALLLLGGLTAAGGGGIPGRGRWK